jgi:hypothetical protein
VISDDRQKRLRELVKKLNGQRKKQAMKIDILCNDFIAAQRNFLGRLRSTLFTAHFYQSILAINDTKKLLICASEAIKQELSDTHITFFVRNMDTFEQYSFGGCHASLTKKQLEDCFKSDVIENICASNKVLLNQEILACGLYLDADWFSTISMAAIPLNTFDASAGFMLLCRPYKFTKDQLDTISAVSAGLSRAIIAGRQQEQPSLPMQDS